MDRVGKDSQPVTSRALPLSLTAAGALAINLFRAFLLARFREHSGSLTRAAFLSARNDALANVAMIVTGIVTVYTRSGRPDLVVGLGIAVLNADAAREVWSEARKEHSTAEV
jgi:Co/Zn/Cd efflux system component